MLLTDEILLALLKSTATNKEALAEARTRRNVVFEAAMTYEGALRTIRSGSIAHNTVSDIDRRVSDADGSVVMNRQIYTAYGPDGGGGGPRELVESIADDLRNLVSQIYPNVYVSINHKHAILFRFREPLADGSDPTVDLVISLNRKEGGLWIPHLPKNRWDAADPETHTKLVKSKQQETNRTSTKVVRAAKLYAKQWTVPLLSSFHLTALMLASIEKGVGLTEGLCALATHSSKSLSRGNTPDPAGISESLKVPSDHDRDTVAKRLAKAAQHLHDAMELDDADDANYDDVLEHLRKVFWQEKARYELELAAEETRKARIDRTINKAASSGKRLRIAVGATPAVRAIASTTAYGGVASDVSKTDNLGTPELDSKISARLESDMLSGGYLPLWAGHNDTALVYKVSIPVPAYGTAVVVNLELRQAGAKVFAPGLADLRHTYKDGSLCMWYPGDSKDNTWHYADGIRSLLDITALHLYKELRFAETGRWPGKEIHYDV